MTTKRKRIRHDRGEAESTKVLIQRVEYDEVGNPVLVHDTIYIEPPTEADIHDGNE